MSSKLMFYFNRKMGLKNMCTGLSLVTKDNKHLFGRNLDVPATYGQLKHPLLELKKGLLQAFELNLYFHNLLLGLV